MGHDQSKEEQVKQIGDQQVTVIENQEVHAETLAQSEIKIWIILVIVGLLLLLKLLEETQKKWKKEAFKAARSVATVQPA